MSLFRELRRRNVFRVAIAYLAGAWLLTEVAGTLFPAFGVPDWAFRFVVILFALGFVPALIFSWAYELTPEGLKREKDVVRDESITHLTAKRLDGITIGLIVVALLFVAADRIWLSPRMAVPPRTPAEVAIKDIPVSAPKPPDVQNLPNSIAVLPFTNRSANPNDVYFVDGIHDDLLTHISKIGAIKTISRTSVMQYRDTEKTIPEIAHELGVGTILEGGVQRAGQQIRINVQLIDARTDEHLWAEIYDRSLTTENIFAIQSEISKAISEALKAVLSPAEQKRIEAVPTENLEAYEFYLIGKQRMARRDTDSLEGAVKYLTEAVEIDPNYALAWSALGDVYLLQREKAGVSENELLLKAQTAIDKALEIDPGLGEAYTSLGMLRYNFNDLDGAEQSYRKAIEVSPNYSTTYHWYSILLRGQGRLQEASEMISKAVQLDPMSAVIRVNLAAALRVEGRHEEALEELEQAVAINPSYVTAYGAMATMEWQVFNRMAKAVQAFVNAIQLDPESALPYAELGQLYLELGAADRAGKLFDRSHELLPDGVGAHWGGLLLGAYQGNKDEIDRNVEGILEFAGTGNWMGQFSVAQLRNQSITRNQDVQALDVYSTTYPELLDEPGHTIGLHNYRAAIDLTLVLQKVGQWEKANHLLDRCQDFIRERPRLGWYGGFWVSDVLILALKGEKKEALSALRQAVDEGWRSLWWYYLRLDPNLDSIRKEAEFQRIVSEVEADMSAQMQEIRDMEDRGEIADVPGVTFNSD